MLTQVDSKHYVAKPNHISSIDYLEAVRGMTNLEGHRVGLLTKTIEKVERINAEYVRRASALFGQERYTGYRTQLRERTAKIWSVADAHPRNDEGRDRVRRMQDTMRAEVLELQSKFGLDQSQLQALQESRLKDLQDLISYPSVPKGGTLYPVTENRIPVEIRTGQTNPWQAFTPPYAGWSWAWSWSRRGGMNPIMTGTDNATLGEVGSNLRVWDSDVGDDDYMHIDYRNRIGIFFTMPVTGLVEAWVEIQNLASYHQVIHEDEWGWSNGHAHAGSSITMQVTAPSTGSEVGARALEVNRSGTDFVDWGWGYSLGSTYWAHLFSPEIYAAGNTLYILFGSYEYLNEIVNDVEYNDQVTYRWFITRVWLRSSGE